MDSRRSISTCCRPIGNNLERNGRILGYVDLEYAEYDNDDDSEDERGENVNIGPRESSTSP